jgi:hypothetical protein
LPPHRLSELTTLDQHNRALAMWPMCPCWTDAQDLKRYTAIGHLAPHGGVFRDPTGATIGIRVEPPSALAGRQVESLHQLLVTVLRQ